MDLSIELALATPLQSMEGIHLLEKLHVKLLKILVLHQIPSLRVEARGYPASGTQDASKFKDALILSTVFRIALVTHQTGP
ncbi:hypothetical protein TgHK011_002753 [Trichoderma gracile]|nr:hypothetical protein TgHK011_002753 [Trichoderma gracile]